MLGLVLIAKLAGLLAAQFGLLVLDLGLAGSAGLYFAAALFALLLAMLHVATRPAVPKDAG